MNAGLARILWQAPNEERYRVKERLGEIAKCFLVAFALRGKQAIEGSRLGLAIVKHTVQFYGYSIEVHSTLGSGTRSVVSLKQKNQ